MITAFQVLGLATAIALLAHVRLDLAVAAGVGLALLGLAWTFYGHLPLVWGGAAAFLLFGYATLGRGFAYFGVGPVYVGEVLLAAGVLVALMHGRGRPLLLHPVTWLLLLMMGWGIVRTLPYLGPYGLDALRDAVLWGYGGFALIVGVLLRSARNVGRIVGAYERALPLILVMAPLGYLVSGPLIDLPIPDTPGSDVSLIQPKGGDVGVHLVGILAFVALGVGRAWRVSPEGRTPERRMNEAHADSASTDRHAVGAWLLSILWVLAWSMVFVQRAAVVTTLIGAALLVALRPVSGWWRPAYVAALLLVAAITFDVSIERGEGRELSVESLQIAAMSLVGPVGSDRYDGTRNWRLDWWQDIIDYAALGPYRFDGKGYGINLANEDGYQVWYDDALRSPHNAHLNVLARSGLPGFISWAAFHGTLLTMLVLGYYARRREGREPWARLNLWLFLYLMAFHVNGSFDVFLEGPQGGIWFWVLIGVALASLVLQSPATAANRGSKASRS